MSTLLDQYEALTDWLVDALGDTVASVTNDGQLVAPQPGRPSILIEPPEIGSQQWKEAEATWKVDVIAGSSTTQPAAFFDCLAALDRLSAAGLNIDSASPITFKSNGLSLAGYQITLNPLD